MSFRLKCPSCGAKNKVIRHCRHCYKKVCSECSVNQFCVDCYVNIQDTNEVEAYWKEKYELLA